MLGRLSNIARNPTSGVWALLCWPLCLGAAELPLGHPEMQTELRKPEPTNLPPAACRVQFEALLETRYQWILTHKMSGTPVFTLLVDPGGHITHAKLELTPRSPEDIDSSEDPFQPLGVSQIDLQYVWMGTVITPANTLVVILGGADTRDLDRALVQRLFPRVLVDGIPRGEGIWILFDHEGRVLQAGEEPFTSSYLRGMLEVRYPGIAISSTRVSPLLTAEGRPIRNGPQILQLHSLWLAPGSQPPDADRDPAGVVAIASPTGPQNLTTSERIP